MLYSSDDTHIKNRNATRATPRQTFYFPRMAQKLYARIFSSIMSFHSGVPGF